MNGLYSDPAAVALVGQAMRRLRDGQTDAALALLDAAEAIEEMAEREAAQNWPLLPPTDTGGW